MILKITFTPKILITSVVLPTLPDQTSIPKKKKVFCKV